MYSHLFQDLRYGLRSLLAKPGVTLIAVLTLALGIGANTALFGIVHALLLSPVRGIGAPERVVEVGRTRGGEGFDTISYLDFRDYQGGTKSSFDGMFVYSMEALNVSSGSEPQRALGLLVSGEYFSTLRTPAFRGRLLTPADDADSGSQSVAVASYSAWQKYFGGNESVIGKTVSVNGHSFTLIGVASPEFHGHIAVLSPDFYLPLHQRSLLRQDSKDLFAARHSLWLLAGGRLKDGIGIDQAQTELSTIAKRLVATYPDSNKNMGVSVLPLRGVPASVRGPLAAFSGLLFAMIGAILLVACVNVAGMLIARGESRRQEIAMRFVLGANRRRVVGQLFAESLLLSLAAGTLGILLASWLRGLIVLIDLPTPFPVSVDVPLGWPVLAFALALTFVTALLFGLLPALRVSSSAPRQSGALSSTQIVGRGTRLRETLVVAQITLTLVLLIGAGLFLRALQRAAAIDVGFDVQHVLSADFDLTPSGYSSEKRARLQQGLLEQTRAMPGVTQASLAALVPLSLSMMEFGCVQGDGRTERELCPNTNIVADSFFATLGTSVRGRAIDATDVSGGRDVCVVNETLAKRLAPNGDAIGRSLAYGEGKDIRTLSVVGIVADGKYASLGEDRQPFLFLPLTQWPLASTSLMAKTDLPPAEFSRRLRVALKALDGTLPAAQVHPLQDTLALSLLPQRIAGLVAGVLGGIGLLLAAVGLYGLIAYHVASRTREFGVKLALGATSTRVLAEVLRRGAWLCAIGLAGGTLISVALAALISGLLFGVSSGDVLAFAGAGILLGAVALLACYLPARRAARTDPMVALRYE
ncbi:MAG: ABC transporter permease [Rudaea sp.]|nr:ABC transporter permease [Rudaea sp.]